MFKNQWKWAAAMPLVLVSVPALAAGTASGTPVLNTATVDYTVGGISQPQLSANNTFTVDRKINLLVEEVGTTTTSVSPNQANAVTTFRLTNQANAPLDFGLLAEQLSGGTAAHGGTDVFQLPSVTIYRDEASGNGTFDGTEAAVTYIDELAADGVVTLFLVGNIPSTVTNGQVAGVRLTAQAKESGLAGTEGAVVTQTATANTTGVDTVFGDLAGVTDGARDGRHSDDDDYTVAAPVLTITKLSRVIEDPFNGTTNPKLIPGATVEYCIVVANALGGATANGVTVKDNLPAELSFVTSSILLNGTESGGVCSGGAAGGAFADPEVSGTLNAIAGNTNATLVFRATVK